MSLRDEFLALKSGEETVTVEQIHDWADENRESEWGQKLEWDDTIAGKRHRFWQIRTLLAIHVKPDSKVRELVSLTIDRVKPSGGYRMVDEVLNTPALKDVYLSDALGELNRVRSKYERITELASVWKVIDRETRKRRVKVQPERRASA